MSEDRCWFACCEMKHCAPVVRVEALPNCSFLRLAECQQIRPLGSIIHSLQLSAPLILTPLWERAQSI